MGNRIRRPDRRLCHRGAALQKGVPRRQLGTVPEDLDACFQILLQGIWLAAEQISEPDAEKIRLHEQQVIRLMEIFFRGLECPDATEKQEVIL